MFSLISGIFKYSTFALVVLVLSHVIEIQGVTVSRHVEKWVKFAGVYSPEKQAKLLTEEYKASLEARMKELHKLDADISPEDQKALRQIIERSEQKN
jgi:GMP synthase PP-ATPase subunit